MSLGRILAMDPAEIADRLRQQVTTRLDLLRYKISLDFAPRLCAGDSRPQPRFFFSPGAVPGLCSRLRQLFPDTAEQIVKHAERICEHRFDLLGYQDVDYGREIDWHCDRVHEKRAPRKPWFQIKYLDFDETGDSKVIWELNRHQHLVTLAKAFRLSGNEKFAAELFRQWEHWHAENPYPIGINWASSLDVAFRVLSWLWVYFLLSDSAVVPSGFRPAWLRSLAVSGRHIERYLSAYFSPNTHLLGEAVALFFIGTLCPEIPSAPRWQQHGWRIVQQEMERQVQADGLHFEQSVYYHVYALDFFLHAAVLGSANQIAAPPQFDRKLERMLEVLAALARSGSVPQLGDDDGGRLFDPSRNRPIHLLDPLATGTVLFGRGDFKTLAGGPREETLWLLGEAGIEEFERVPAARPTANSLVFRASGLYVMTSENLRRQLVIDAGLQGAHTAGHGHADALSLTATSAGQDLLIDSGTFAYVGSERDLFRGTRAHNTLVVAGQDQAEPKGPFGWGRLPKARAEGWVAGKTFDFFMGSHDGYSRLPNPVVHRRFVFSLKSGFWLVRDLALGFGEYPLDLFWHVAPALRAADGQENVFLDGHRGLRFVTVEGGEWAHSIEEHANSPTYGQKENHPVLHIAAKTQLPAEFVTLLVPVDGAVATKVPSEHLLTRIATTSPQPSVVGYRYKTAVGEHCMFFAQGKAWALDGWSSDAEFLYWGRIGGAPSHVLICCHATFVRWSGLPILTAQPSVLRCEILGNADEFQVVSTDPNAVTVNSEGWKMLLAGGTPQLEAKITSEEKG